MSLDGGREEPAVLAEVQRAIDAANANVSRAESIRKFTILSTELTEASGHLTPKMSIKRNVIMEDFADEIEAMYSARRPPRATRSCTEHRAAEGPRLRGALRVARPSAVRERSEPVATRGSPASPSRRVSARSRSR